MEKLNTQLIEIENFMKFSNQLSPKISEANVGWHLEHSLLVITAIIDGLISSNPDNYAPKNSFARFFILATGFIPRKKGKAPEVTIPKTNFDEMNMIKNLAYIRTNFHEIYAINPNSYIPHPYFGHLNVKETLRFLTIHTNHHLKIVKDILK